MNLMNAEVRLKTLAIEYESKLENMKYLLDIDEQDDEPDMEYILRQRSGILLVEGFLKDLAN